MPTSRIVVIGASAGGVEVLTKLMSELPRDFNGSVFVVLHTMASSESQLPRILDRVSALIAKHPEDGEAIKTGTVYVARPNHHLIIEDGRVRSLSGPRQNGYRPSANVLFESAAKAFGRRVAGVILSGSLDDGTLGLQEIKKAGGIAIVQDPYEAIFTGMPLSALANVQVDYRCSVAEMPEILQQFTYEEIELEEIPMAGSSGNAREVVRQLHQPHDSVEDVTGYSCPECGGVLQELHSSNMVEFKCHVGHRLSESALLQAQGETLEAALWIALRVLEERISLAERAERRALENGHQVLATRFSEQSAEAHTKAETIRNVLLGGQSEPPVTRFQDGITSDSLTSAEAEN